MNSQELRFAGIGGTTLQTQTDKDSFPGLSLTRVSLQTLPSGRWEGVAVTALWPEALHGDIALRFDLMAKRPQEGDKSTFYAELTAGETVLDALWLPEGAAVQREGDSAVYEKISVTLYARQCHGSRPEDWTLNLYPGRPGTGYQDDFWLSGFAAEPVSPDAFPPELMTAPAVPKKDFSCPPCEVSPIDKALIPAARDMLAYLKGVAEQGFMLYGVQNFPYEKGGRAYKDAPLHSSDCFDLCGTDPAVFGVDSLSLIGLEDAFRMPGIQLVHRDLSDPRNFPLYVEGCVRRSVEAWQRGSLTTLSLHMSDPGMVYDQYSKDNRNPCNGRTLYSPDTEFPWNFHGYGYGNSTRTTRDQRDGRERSPHKTMLRLYRAIHGSADKTDTGVLEVFDAYIDITVKYCLALQEREIPVLYRPFHENSGDWFWWGNSGCENEDGSYNPEIFKDVWRHLVEYLLKKGVHNCLYVYSPNGSDFDNEEKLGTHAFRPYAITYPGDAWVDICAYDDYTLDEEAMRGDIKTVTRFAAAHGKIAAASEVNGGSVDPATNAYLFRTLFDTAHLPCNLAYLLQWTPPHFSPYLVSPTRANSPAGNAYVKQLSDPRVLMAGDTRGFRPQR